MIRGELAYIVISSMLVALCLAPARASASGSDNFMNEAIQMIRYFANVNRDSVQPRTKGEESAAQKAEDSDQCEKFNTILRAMENSQGLEAGKGLFPAGADQGRDGFESALSGQMRLVNLKVLSILDRMEKDRSLNQVRMPVSDKNDPGPVETEEPRLATPRNSVRMPVRGAQGYEAALRVYSSFAQDSGEGAAKADTVRSKVTGELSAMFESGGKGIDAVGYDRRGGTSYGKYQISSRAGSMKRFIRFLREKAPDLAQRLAKSGPSNTGKRWGAMPRQWKRIAAEKPELFEKLQDEFIRKTNYLPALAGVQTESELQGKELSPVLKEVLWSTSVQHGANGAARIFKQALNRAKRKGGQDFDKKLIEEVYNTRKQNFGRASRRVRNAVKQRLAREKEMALAMLENGRKRVA